MQTQFTPPPLPESSPLEQIANSKEDNRQQSIEAQIESSPLAKLAQLKEENWQ
jgi:hypothetical protein